MQESTNEYQPAPPKRRRGPPKGNRNALKTGRHTAERKDFRRRLRATLKRAQLAAAAGRALARAKDDEAYAKAYADLLAAATFGGLPRRSGEAAKTGEGGADFSPKTEKQFGRVE